MKLKVMKFECQKCKVKSTVYFNRCYLCGCKDFNNVIISEKAQSSVILNFRIREILKGYSFSQKSLKTIKDVVLSLVEK